MRQEQPETLSARDRNAKLKSNYGLTIEQWGALFAVQGRRCACCGADKPGSKYGWSTDHDHETSVVRGILCWRCNRVLGMLGDNAAGVASSAVQYNRYLRGGAYEPGLAGGLV